MMAAKTNDHLLTRDLRSTSLELLSVMNHARKRLVTQHYNKMLISKVRSIACHRDHHTSYHYAVY